MLGVLDKFHFANVNVILEKQKLKSEKQSVFIKIHNINLTISLRLINWNLKFK